MDKNEKKSISVRLTSDLHEWLKNESDRLGVSMNSFIAMALNQYKDEYDGKKK